MVGGRHWMARGALAMALAIALPCVAAPGPSGGADDDCLSCHVGIEPAGVGHAMPCVDCHLAPADRDAPSTDHGRVLANPSAPEQAPAICGPCHGGQVVAVTASVHATLAGIINQTRYLWGAQAAVDPPLFGANGLPRPLPEPSPTPRSPAMLVDDFLRARCLGCHIGIPGAAAPGLHRGSGCAACHVEYAADGLYAGGDAAMARAVDRLGPGRPARHGLGRPRGDDACLRCHHGNHVGGDLHGLYARDDAPMFQQALSWGKGMPRPHGAAVHVLARDVHAERGMGCLDCHSGRQIMGLARDARPSCRHCHDGNGAAPAFVLDTPSHNRQWHGRVACFACHAQWTYGDYGLSVLRRDDDGTWCLDWRFRRWEGLALGVDRAGRIAPLRPRHQYLVSYVDRLGRTVLDSVRPERGDGSGPGWAFAPYAPHTTGRVGRPCQECHGNPEATGQAPAWALPSDDGRMSDMALLEASPPVQGQGRLLDAGERRRLLAPAAPYREAFAGYLLDLLEDR